MREVLCGFCELFLYLLQLFLLFRRKDRLGCRRWCRWWWYRRVLLVVPRYILRAGVDTVGVHDRPVHVGRLALV